jgi:hypothetical protein
VRNRLGLPINLRDGGIDFEVILWDSDSIEFSIRCYTGRLSGPAKVYLSHDDLPQTAEGSAAPIRQGASLSLLPSPIAIFCWPKSEPRTGRWIDINARCRAPLVRG